jgi:PKD repeat protein
VTVSAASRPVAAFTFSPTSPTTGQSASFNGAGSTDTGATITSYSWAFGDGSTGSGVSASHSYTTAGTYTVTLTVGDSTGQSNSVSHSVTVTAAGNSPVAAFTFSPTTAVHGQWVSFNASGSTDSAAFITSYSWTFGDGSSSAGTFAFHAFSTAGTYAVKLTVTDSIGHSASVTHTVTVK